ncbi:MAG TPA: hypothetical protein VJ867_04020 [Gemmatimonadaceae bacterium]|nr:hypothetical protein [Gemmatimonadaceae bacterium]
MHAGRWTSAAILVALSVPIKPASAQSQVLGGCSSFGTGIRTVGGAVLGAWVGFVVAKAKLSDWNENSHTPAAIRQRNQITIGGAIAGGLIGNLAFRNPCRMLRSDAAANPGVPRVSSARRPITREEIDRSGVSGSVYDLIYALRRNWLNLRGLQSMSEATHVEQDSTGKDYTVYGEPQLVVYLDNVKLGTLSELRGLPVAGITGVIYYDPSEATFKWGTGHSHGAIQVLSVTDINGVAKPQNRIAAPTPSGR